MSKRILSILAAAVLLVCSIPGLVFAKAKQMNDGVPVWTEQAVRDYALAFNNGKIMNTLWGYYDLQIRRYLPQHTFETLLTELEWATGKLEALGTYRCFEEPEFQTKTHVLHLCMEKQDLDMYFTHKNKPDDWEIMAVEFAFADEEPVVGNDENLVESAMRETDTYDELQISFGDGTNLVTGTLTIPKQASAQNPVPACVIVHDWGMRDRNGTLGGTALYADLAHTLGEMGIASIRYDMNDIDDSEIMKVKIDDEFADDAVAACNFLLNESFVDKNRLVLIGHGIGAMLAPRIVLASDRSFNALVMISGAYTTPLNQLAIMDIEELRGASDAERANTAQAAAEFKKMKRKQITETVILGRSGLYFEEVEKDDQVKLLKRLKMPTYIIEGGSDPYLTEATGVSAYAAAMGDGANYMKYEVFDGLNHLLMADKTLDSTGMPDYSAEASLDEQAGNSIAQWILN